MRLKTSQGVVSVSKGADGRLSIQRVADKDGDDDDDDDDAPAPKGRVANLAPHIADAALEHMKVGSLPSQAMAKAIAQHMERGPKGGRYYENADGDKTHVRKDSQAAKVEQKAKRQRPTG